MICEYCSKEHDGTYGSGRFCSEKCARGFSSRNKREEINRKVSLKLKRIPDKLCSICGVLLSYNNSSGFCKACKPPAKSHSEIITKFRQKRKVFLVEYKGGKCEKCGEKRPWVLTFHHKDPNKKDFSLSKKGTTKSLKRDLEEVDKCVLLCHNCHNDFHHENYLNKILLEEYLSVDKL
jgi:hypothetical protein